jgi:uncharacterized membrane protein
MQGSQIGAYVRTSIHYVHSLLGAIIMVSGPLQLLMIGYAEDNFPGRILPDLRALGREGNIRILDILFAKKDKMGKIWALKNSEFTAEESVRFGAIAGALIGLGTMGREESKQGTGISGFSVAQNDSGLGLEDIAALVKQVSNGSSFAMALIEHQWAIKLKDLIIEAGGTLLAQGLVAPKALAHLESELPQKTNVSAQKEEPSLEH